MKQIFTLLAIVCVMSANAQFSAGMHVGGSNKSLAAGFHTQYIFQNRFTAGLNMTALSSKIEPAFLQTRFGFTIGETEQTGITMQPYIGYSYAIQSFDQKQFGGHFTGGFMMRYQFSEIGSVYADVNFPAPKYTVLSIGIAGIIPHECIK